MRGLSFPLVSYGFINCIYFGVYGNTLKFIKTRRRSTSSSRSDALDLVAAGVVAGLAQLTVACPVDAVKVILQSQIEKEGRVLHAKSKAYNVSLVSRKPLEFSSRRLIIDLKSR